MSIKDKIRELAASYSEKLKVKIVNRVKEMKEDDKSHFLIYQVLGITDEEGELIDMYQNKGRFLYNNAGSFLERATLLCFQEKYPRATRKRIKNTIGKKPKEFEIDCLINKDAIEIKWRDATTDGDHITKEHSRIQAIKSKGYKPIRVMFYYPNRSQSIKVQEMMKTMYRGIGGKYYVGDEAWNYVLIRTGVNLQKILIDIAKENKRMRK
jgi:hypothetical protein